MSAYRALASTILSEWETLQAHMADENLRVYRSNASGLSSTVYGLGASFVSRSANYLREVGAERTPSDEESLRVIRSFAFYLNDVAIAVAKEQKDRLSRGRFLLPRLGIILNFKNNGDFLRRFGSFLNKRRGENSELAAADQAYKTFQQLTKDGVDALKNANDVREQKKEERESAPAQSSSASVMPTAATPEVEAEEAALYQEPSAEEVAAKDMDTEEIIVGSVAKVYVRRYWWVFVGSAIGLYAVSVWRARRKRRQLEERF